MKLLEAPQIQQRLAELLAPLTENPKHQEVLICIMIVAMLGRTISTDVITDIFGAEALAGAEFRADPRVRQLVGFDSYTVNVRSPIVAEFYLTRIVARTATLSVLVELAKRASVGRYASGFFRSIFASLQRFALIQRIFPLEGKLATVTSYYEAIKSLEGCTKNFHFWLQYAIACLTLGERERSKRYFDQAYAIARERGVDTYQVDNHYSRYLLETAVEYPEPSDAMECFRHARDIINRQIKDERLHYPYRVALNYVRFINRFGTRLKEAWVDEIEQATLAVVERVPELPEERRNNRYVKQCAAELPYVLYKCSQLKARLASGGDDSEMA
jgi:tetratricopeptide (TPR) repeat protein